MNAGAIGGSRDLDRTKADILRVATDHFQERGFFGARVDEIAAETATTKRMIYYCYGSKDQLFAACLQNAYEGIRDFEAQLHLEDLPPLEAIARYVAETLRYHEKHPELAFLVRTENVLGGVHIDAERSAKEGGGIVRLLDQVLTRGRQDVSIVTDVTGIDLHVVVSALANFRITNEITIEKLFGVALRNPHRFEHDIHHYVGLVLAWLTCPAPSATPADPGLHTEQPATTPVVGPRPDQKGIR